MFSLVGTIFVINQLLFMGFKGSKTCCTAQLVASLAGLMSDTAALSLTNFEQCVYSSITYGKYFCKGCGRRKLKNIKPKIGTSFQTMMLSLREEEKSIAPCSKSFCPCLTDFSQSLGKTC